MKGVYRDNKRVGVWWIYDKKGRIDMIEDYGNAGGIVDKRIHYNDNGEIERIVEFESTSPVPEQNQP